MLPLNCRYPSPRTAFGFLGYGLYMGVGVAAAVAYVSLVTVMRRCVVAMCCVDRPQRINSRIEIEELIAYRVATVCKVSARDSIRHKQTTVRYLCWFVLHQE